MVLTLDTPSAANAAAAPTAEKPSLAGLGREGCARRWRRRRAGQAAADARRSAVELDVRARRARLRGHVRRLQGPAGRRCSAALYAGAARDRHRAGVGRRHAQVAAAAADPRARGKRARDRDRLHPRGRPRHAVHLEPGRLHADLLVLPYRHAAAGAQPRGAGDRRPDPAGARPHRRLAGRGVPPATAACCRSRIARSPTSC